MQKPIAIVGIGAVLPDANDPTTFWKNILSKKYSIKEVPANRWNTAFYFNSDPLVPDKTYTKIGAFIEDFNFDPIKNGIIIPPKILANMDKSQVWGLAATKQLLDDYGYPKRPLNLERTAVIIGNACASELHDETTIRLATPEYIDALSQSSVFKALPKAQQTELINAMANGINARYPEITEDTMPNELGNVIAGRIANVFNFNGTSYITDAACGSSLAAIQNAVSGLQQGRFDVAVTGGVDHNMNAGTFIKFSKIGALSATGSRPYAEGADGFVMGEGAALFLLKRLEDAERDGDKIYAVIRSTGASSDGKGKGITAPNPIGQQKAIRQAWDNVDFKLEPGDLIEGHGTSTKVGDVAEVDSLVKAFASDYLPVGSVWLGSVKSNIGHLKAAAGAAGMLKVAMALYYKTLPPTANFHRPNPNIEFDTIPFRVNTQMREWTVPANKKRRAAVSAFGFGGTNFHIILEEYNPHLSGTTKFGAMTTARPDHTSAQTVATMTVQETPILSKTSMNKTNEVNQSIANADEIQKFILNLVSEKTGYPTDILDPNLDLEADLGVDTVKQAELFAEIRTHFNIPRQENTRLSDYNTIEKVTQFVLNSLGTMPDSTPSTPVESVAKTVAPSADEQLTPFQGLYFASAETIDELTAIIRADRAGLDQGIIPPSVCPTADHVAKHERLAIDYVNVEDLTKRLNRVLSAFESDDANLWNALQAQGVYRGSGKPGKVAFLFPGQGSQYANMLADIMDHEPLIADLLKEADEVMTPILGKPLSDYIFVPNDKESIAQAEASLKDTKITQPAMLFADVAIMRVLKKYGFSPDIVAGHSLGEYAALIASDVLNFGDALKIVSARGREMAKVSLEDNGCMAAVSASGDVIEEVLNEINGYVVLANINSPAQSVIGGATAAIDEAIERFKAREIQAVKIPVSHAFHTKIVAPASEPLMKVIAGMDVRAPKIPIIANVNADFYPTTKDEIVKILGDQVASPVRFVATMQKMYAEGARVFVESGPKRVLTSLVKDNLKDNNDVFALATNHPRKGGKPSFNDALAGLYAAGVIPVFDNDAPVSGPVETIAEPTFNPANITVNDITNKQVDKVVITGVGIGLPGKNKKVFAEDNIDRMMNGEMMIDPIDLNTRQQMLDKRVTRLVKSETGAIMQEIDDIEQTIHFAGQGGEFDFCAEFGFDPKRAENFDNATKLAIAAGIDALRDAGIPLVKQYKKTSTGSFLPDSWKLPKNMQDDTGVIFCSAFPGMTQIDQAFEKYNRYDSIRKLHEQNEQTIAIIEASNLSTDEKSALLKPLTERRESLAAEQAELDYHFDRRYIFQILAMGHSQFAETIGAKGPNTSVNAACATTTFAVGLAEDWIRQGRARRIIIVAGDDVTNPVTMPWIGTGLFANGAATTESDLRLAAIPFDRRRNGLIMGMGAAALVVETASAAQERGVTPLVEILSTQIANSAFHGTRIDVNHVSDIMNRLINVAETRHGINRQEIAGKTVFVSHETYTPARGGSASAEIHALRDTFGADANRIIIANTKGFTGHTMGVGVEDVLAVRMLQYGKVPPIAFLNDGLFEPDPELGDLNLSKGGNYPVEYALRLGAGFGSQIAMSLTKKIAGTDDRIDHSRYAKWLIDVSGYERPELETVQRTLRIKDQGVPKNEPLPNQWAYGAVSRIAFTTISASDSSETPSVLTTTNLEIRTSSPAPAATNPTVTGTTDTSAIRDYVLSVVSEKTGYPTEMLDLELDLEADLGIDTVKQAELFAEIRTHYNIPRREDLTLTAYNTLAKVIQFVKDGLTDQNGNATSAVVAPPESVKTDSTTADDTSAIRDYVLSVVSEKTGYPTEMLDLELDLEADLGIDTVKQAELFAEIRTHYNIPRREDLTLTAYNTLAKVIQFVKDGLTEQNVNTTSPVVVSLESGKTDSAPNDDASAIRDYVLSVVSEKTGYPTEMLDLELDLEADLGIDTVKQAELFAEIRTHYNIPRREDLTLTAYNTLAKVIQFVKDGLAAQSVAQEEEKTGSESTVKTNDTLATNTIEDETEIKIIRRRPNVTIRPRIDLCLSSGVSLDSTSSVLIVADGNPVADALKEKLAKTGATVLRMSLSDVCDESFGKTCADTTIQGVYFFAPLTTDKVTLIDPETKARISESLWSVATSLPNITFFFGITKMGGKNGVSRTIINPVHGLVSGFTKALGKERDALFTKVVDFEETVDTNEAATAIISETLFDRETPEISRYNGLRFTVRVIPSERPDRSAKPLPLEENAVYLITGGTSGISAPIVNDLAQHKKGKFYLLGRSEITPEVVELANLPDAERQAAVLADLQKDGSRATPVQVSKRLAHLDRIKATVRMIENVKELGGEAIYLSCDVMNPESVRNAVARIKEESGKLNVLIHAAGTDRSRKIENKPLEEFRQVIDTKIDGIVNVMHSLNDADLIPERVVLFGSIAGRFGNSGQTDYAAANDTLAKIAYAIRKDYPVKQAIAIDWSAWGEVGMAAQGYIPKLMKMAGIDLLPPALAAPVVRLELDAGTNGEIIIAGSLGAMDQDSEDVPGIDVDKANVELHAENPVHNVSSQLVNYTKDGVVTLENEFDPTEESFLFDHAMNGIPILPGVVGIEGFAVAANYIAQKLSLADQPYQVSEMENIRFLVPMKFYRNQKKRVTWKAYGISKGDTIVIYISLESDLMFLNRKPEHVVHFRGEVVLAPEKAINTAKETPVKWLRKKSVESKDIYNLYFHGPSFQVLDSVQRNGNKIIGKVSKDLKPIVMDGVEQSIIPLLIELCFQTAGVYQAGNSGIMALPSSIHSLTVYDDNPKDIKNLFAEVTYSNENDLSAGYNARVLDKKGAVILEINDYKTAPLPFPVEENLLEPMRMLADKPDTDPAS